MRIGLEHHQTAVYPRGCGELIKAPLSDRTTGGLSPWVRGTHYLFCPVVAHRRFIPVGAGNSISMQGIHMLDTVYPRGCGELAQTVVQRLTKTGLSPWVRGTPSSRVLSVRVLRFIPVGAGNSVCGYVKTDASAVYPRGCGELAVAKNLPKLKPGLSPWVRGTHHVCE